MRKELVIVLSLVVNVLTLFAGVWYNERRQKRDNSEARVQRVFEKYMEFRRANATVGCDGALKAGIATLQSNAEILVFAALVVGRELHPLESDYATVFAEVDQFFRYAAEQRVNFNSTPIEKIIAESGASRLRDRNLDTKRKGQKALSK
jgi:hypothetical protein